MSRVYIKTFDLSKQNPGQSIRNFCYRNNFSTGRKADGSECGDGLIKSQLIESYKHKRDYLILAHDGNKPVAWAIAYKDDNKPMFQAYVPVKMRRKGIGTRMLKIACKKMGRMEVYAIDTSDKFFKANGLTPAGRITGKRLCKK